MATTKSDELAKQSCWQLRAEVSDLNFFNQLIENEFLETADLQSLVGGALTDVIRFAGAEVPYYRELFTDLGLKSRSEISTGTIQSIPVLDKLTLKSQFRALHSRKLPAGSRFGGYTASSGSTSEPTRVAHTHLSRLMFGFLKQRELRWFRFDPLAMNAWIRIAGDIPRRPDGSAIGHGETLETDRWPVVGSYFKTGPFKAYLKTNPVDDCIAWLCTHRPKYLTAASVFQEQLALAAVDRPLQGFLAGTLAISEQLTGGMQSLIESRLNAAVHENYGLNEIGLVAIKCPEGGRYHSHPEHVFVEIVDDCGHPVEEGRRGRIVVTGLTNHAMPLIRYDTGDTACAVTGDCPCGRNLPSFEGPLLRRSRIEPLPVGSLEKIEALLHAVQSLPDALSKPIRGYQVYLRTGNRYELRLMPQFAPSPKLLAHLNATWSEIAPDEYPLAIITMNALALRKSGKLFHYVSDYIPEDAGFTGPQ